MEAAELLKSTIITGIELHAGCLLLVALLFANMKSSFERNGREQDPILHAVYTGSILMMLSDCAWSALSMLDRVGNFAAYGINLIYFLSSLSASAAWFFFCAKELETELSKSRAYRWGAALPYLAVTILYLLSPVNGLIFSVREGEYIRGSLFFLDPLVKLGYITAASIIAIIGSRKQDIGYLRKKDLNLALFSLPVIVCGIFQTITGVDFNCLGVTCGLVWVYIVGITNRDNENTDAIYSLANSFDASYIVNMDTGRIRPLHEDRMHGPAVSGMESMDYNTHFPGVLTKILLPEDRESTLEAYDLSNVANRFAIDRSFSIRYRVKEDSGQTAMHTASFIRAASKGKNEFLLGVNNIHMDSLLYERNEALSHENQRLEQINLSIIESVAKMVEARDGGSGAHIVRVKKLTEILARAVMEDHPEFGLDEEKVKLISSASVLHDVGKIVIPDAILLKPGRLTKEEFDIMKTHCAKGCDILNMFPLGLDDAFMEVALTICRRHHEKYDGKGYPDGLAGERIPISAQIVSVADCFDALVSDRPYKKAYTPEKAYEMILNGECGAFSPVIIDTLQKQKEQLCKLVRIYT